MGSGFHPHRASFLKAVEALSDVLQLELEQFFDFSLWIMAIDILPDLKLVNSSRPAAL
jgi:hypothetical protein